MKNGYHHFFYFLFCILFISFLPSDLLANVLDQYEISGTKNLLQIEINNNVPKVMQKYEKGTAKKTNLLNGSVNHYKLSSKQKNRVSTTDGDITTSIEIKSKKTTILGKTVGKKLEVKKSTEITDNNKVSYSDLSKKDSKLKKFAKKDISLKIKESTEFGKFEKGLIGFDNEGDEEPVLRVLGVSGKGEYGGLTFNAKDGLQTNASYEAEIDLIKVQDEWEGHLGDDGPLSVDLAVEAEAGVLAEVEAKGELGIGVNGVHAKGSVDAFAGGKLEGEGSITFLKNYLPVTVTGKVNGTAGIGGTAEGTFDVSWSKITIGSELSATFGLGGGGGVTIEIDISEYTDELKGTYDWTKEHVVDGTDKMKGFLSGFWPSNERIEFGGGGGHSWGNGKDAVLGSDASGSMGTVLEPKTKPVLEPILPYDIIPDYPEIPDYQHIPDYEKIPW
jgi:hypothetical protein